ncbi:MAG: hypothetical protein OXE53_09015 [Deltaproteobacteria bacterium]|nr:hypothetical protein [Deltaproteobacteria bacterium]
MTAKTACVLLLVGAAGCSTLSGARNPKVQVSIDHPPGAGVNIAKVAFAPPAGGCSVAVVTAVTEGLLLANVEVASDVTVVASRADLGDSGPRAATVPPREFLLNVRDSTCEADRSTSSRTEERIRTKTRKVDGKKKKYKEKYRVTTNKATTRFDVGLSVRAADLRNGNVVAAWSIAEYAQRSNTATNARPAFPDAAPLRRRAVDGAREELMRWLLPWNETVRLTFYDAEECGMALTFAHVNAARLDSARKAARRGIDACAAEDAEFRAAARYNAGMVEFISGNLDAALRAFDTAAGIDPASEHASRAAYEVNRARELQDKIHTVNALDADSTLKE